MNDDWQDTQFSGLVRPVCFDSLLTDRVQFSFANVSCRRSGILPKLREGIHEKLAVLPRIDPGNLPSL